MLYTSQEANKLLKKLSDEQSSLLTREIVGKEFLAAVGEDLESVRPNYDFRKTQDAIYEVEAKIR